MDNNIFMIEKHEIYVGKRRLADERSAAVFSKIQSRLRLGVQAAGSSDYQALKGVNKRKRVEFYEKRSIGLCY